jgi:hypothetical protein
MTPHPPLVVATTHSPHSKVGFFCVWEREKAEQHGHCKVSYSMFSQMFDKIFLETVSELEVKKSVV